MRPFCISLPSSAKLQREITKCGVMSAPFLVTILCRGSLDTRSSFCKHFDSHSKHFDSHSPDNSQKHDWKLIGIGKGLGSVIFALTFPLKVFIEGFSRSESDIFNDS